MMEATEIGNSSEQEVLSCSEATIQALQQWLLTTGTYLKDAPSFIDAYCHELRHMGIPVERVWFSAVVLHSLVAARAWKWEAPDKITDFSWGRDDYIKFRENIMEVPEEEHGNSPMYQLMALGAKFVRIKSTDEFIPEDCDWMLKENYTELYGLPANNSSGSFNVQSTSKKALSHAALGELEGGFTWSTKAEGGFTDAQIKVLDKTLAALCTVLRLYLMKHNSVFLLQTYLGEDAGIRVHRGEIDRGEGLTIRSAIWFSDVRGFTQMSGELDRSELVDLINGVFEVTQNVVKKHKGQVLKFMGDGCMAIFSSSSTSFQRDSFTMGQKRELDDDHGSKVCQRARLAAAEVQDALETLKRERETKGLRGASVGVGLHYGDISYGNVGSPSRLDFTVLGPHVNLASRTESLCGKLGAKVLATEDFVKLDGEVGAWTSRGNHEVKGVADPVPIFELEVLPGSNGAEA